MSDSTGADASPTVAKSPDPVESPIHLTSSVMTDAERLMCAERSLVLAKQREIASHRISPRSIEHIQRRVEHLLAQAKECGDQPLVQRQLLKMVDNLAKRSDGKWIRAPKKRRGTSARYTG